MTICGIEIKGSEAIFALAGPDLEHVAVATKKIAWTTMTRLPTSKPSQRSLQPL